MPDLPWDKFLALPGDPRKNWELLCREVIRRQYERYGALITRKQQPGVEFHISVNQSGGVLGDQGRHWGWQCKYFDVDDSWADGSRLKANRRLQIESSIEKSVSHVPGLTDWVLWVRDKMGADDARWFRGLEADLPFSLHCWDEETMVGMLTGEAEPLMKTWFGELGLNQQTLNENRRESLAPIDHRYVEGLHAQTPTETVIRAAMPDRGLATEVRRFQSSLDVAASDVVAADVEAEDSGAPRETSFLREALDTAIESFAELNAVLENRQLPEAPALRAGVPSDGSRTEFVEAVNGLRYKPDSPLPLDIAQAARALALAWEFQAELAGRLETTLVGVLGRAGAGKTHLAASLCGPSDSARGVLLLGLDFGAEIADSDLARFSRLSESRDELLEAMEAFGVREGRRVPLVIDGLNESDDPSSWKPVLARLRSKLSKLPHVVAVVTVRPKYADLTLPEGTEVEVVPGLEGIEEEAVDRYFDFYKIDATVDALHWWRPSDPLLLSIFCRTVNPARTATVTAEQLPKSLHEVFTAYVADIYRRVATVMKIESAEIQQATRALAQAFLDEGVRTLERGAVTHALGDSERAPHKQSLRFQLENEEILTRDVAGATEYVQWSYDLLAGHLIAESLLDKYPDRRELGGAEVEASIGDHPLSEDIVAGLSGLLVEEGIELVDVLSGGVLAGEAALSSVRLAASEVGGRTVQEMSRIFAERPAEVLGAISGVTFEPGHPFNGAFLDDLLLGLEVWKRDLVWTEWVRQRSGTISEQLNDLGDRLSAGRENIDVTATLTWLSWLTTTTDKRLRDEAVSTLYLLGMTEPTALFRRVVQMLEVNDPSVAENTLAASYGVVMAAQDPDLDMDHEVIAFARELSDLLLTREASRPTFHWLIREYAYRINQFAAWISGGEFEAPTAAAQPRLPQPNRGVDSFAPDGDQWEAVEGAFGMDFANYTVGHLIEGRGNYDESHQRYLEILGEIRARIARLGWTEHRFGEIDRVIGERNFSRDNDPEKVERYGKKYGWAGFYEAAGRLSDSGELEHIVKDENRLPDLPIDPSFPIDAAPLPIELRPWASLDSDDEIWMRQGEIEVQDELLRTTALGDGVTWVAVDGYLRHQPREADRRVFGFIRGLIALEGWSTVEDHVGKVGVGNNLVPRNPGDYYCFAGEAPWSPTFDSFYSPAIGNPERHLHKLGPHLSEGPEVELLAVDFNWESHHSVLNQAKIGSFPSKRFCHEAGLRKRRGRPEFADENGNLGAVSTSLDQPGWNGHILYVREDLLVDYTAEVGGDWGWVVWGEKGIFPKHWEKGAPEWLKETRRSGADGFSSLKRLADLG